MLFEKRSSSFRRRNHRCSSTSISSYSCSSRSSTSRIQYIHLYIIHILHTYLYSYLRATLMIGFASCRQRTTPRASPRFLEISGKIAKPLMTRTDVYSNVLSAGNCSVIRCAFYILHTSYASASAEISTVPPPSPRGCTQRHDGGGSRTRAGRARTGGRKSESAFK